jgi:cation diffusion facilitator family transporter
MTETNERTASANRVTWVGFFVNLVLTAAKLAAGIVGHSGAMIADAVHSLSDFATDIVVLASFRVVGQPADKGHDYGHGKYETLATAIIGVALLLVGAGIFWSGATKIWSVVVKGQHMPAPGYIALIAAVASIVVKEWLYRYTVIVGKRIDSQAVIANAWHHRSDAFSSIGTMLGIGGAILLGEKWHILDPLAAIVVSFFIVKVAVEISSGSVKELVEESLDDAAEAEIIGLAAGIPGVGDPHKLRTRRIGHDVAVDLHVRVDPDLRVAAAHDLATEVETRIRARFGPTTIVSVHVEPRRPA